VYEKADWGNCIPLAIEGFRTMDAIKSGKTQDRRIAKTRAALGRALFALMQTREWENITIQLLCDEADVARSSFYAHFDSLGGLLDAVISANMPSAIAAGDGGGVVSALTWLVDHIAENRKLFFHTVNSPSGAAVLSRFKAAIKNDVRAGTAAKGFELSETQLAFLVGGTFEAVQAWAVSWRMDRLAALKADVSFFAETMLSGIAPLHTERRSG
jgi:AcrR family transcriptional regulator